MFPLASKATLTFTFLYLVATAVSAPIPSLSRRTQLSRLVARTGSVIDFRKFSLQLPDGTTQPGSKLAGFKNQYLDPTGGSIVMTVPGGPSSGKCKTTPHSKHCRTEFRETSPKTWSPGGTNTMTVTLSAEPDEKGTCVGQIHINDSESSKPVCELFYHRDGSLSIGIEQSAAGGNEKTFPIGHAAAKGEKFSYILDYSEGKLGVTLNGVFHDFTKYLKFSPKGAYFKVGNYNQGEDPSTVTLYSASIKH